MALPQGVVYLEGRNERTAGFLTTMALPLRANLTGRHKRGRWRLIAGENGGCRCGVGSAVTAS